MCISFLNLSNSVAVKPSLLQNMLISHDILPEIVYECSASVRSTTLSNHWWHALVSTAAAAAAADNPPAQQVRDNRMNIAVWTRKTTRQSVTWFPYKHPVYSLSGSRPYFIGNTWRLHRMTTITLRKKTSFTDKNHTTLHIIRKFP